MAHPLKDLLKKDKKFIWSNECPESYDLLKKRFTEEPVLMMLDHTRLFQIQVDSSLFATGGVLTQMDMNGDHHACAYLSKGLAKEQRNYNTGDRELLAIVHTLKEWWHYIQESGHTTTILSDHNNLRHFKVPQTIGRYIFQNLISNWFIYQGKRTFKWMHYQEDQISVLMELITKT